MNRIANDPTSPPDPCAVKPASAKAYQAWAFRCPSCGLAQFADRSTTDVQNCNRCGKPVTVEVRK